MKIVIECLRENLHLPQGKMAEIIERTQSGVHYLPKASQRLKDEESSKLKKMTVQSGSDMEYQ